MTFSDIKPLEAYLEKHTIKGLVFQFNVPLLGYNKLSNDVKKHSYWVVDSASFHDDVMTEFHQGNLILNHKIHAASIIITKDLFEKYIYHPQTKVFTDYDDFYALEQEIEEAYYKRSDDIEATGTIAPGYIYSTGVADGSANYIVTKVTKANVFIEHISFGDGYADPNINAFNGKVPRHYFERISHFGRAPLAFRKTCT